MKCMTRKSGWVTILTVGLLTQAMVMEAQAQSLWTPTEIKADLAAWYDAADTNTLWQNTTGTTPATAAGHTVARWNDKSNNGYNMLKPSSVAAPAIDATEKNGKKTVYFNETAAVLQLGTASPNSFFGEVSVYLVVASKRTATISGSSTDFVLNTHEKTADAVPNAGWEVTVVNGYKTTAKRFAGESGGADGLVTDFRGINGRSVGVYTDANNVLTQNVYAVLSFEFNSTTNAAAGRGFTMGGTVTLGAPKCGSSIAEAIIVPRHDTTKRQIMEGYLGHKWGVTLDSNHPYFAAAPVIPPSGTMVMFQ